MGRVPAFTTTTPKVKWKAESRSLSILEIRSGQSGGFTTTTRGFPGSPDCPIAPEEWLAPREETATSSTPSAATADLISKPTRLVLPPISELDDAEDMPASDQPENQVKGCRGIAPKDVCVPVLGCSKTILDKS